jgi:hypothetical protein
MGISPKLYSLTYVDTTPSAPTGKKLPFLLRSLSGRNLLLPIWNSPAIGLCWRALILIQILFMHNCKGGRNTIKYSIDLIYDISIRLVFNDIAVI